MPLINKKAIVTPLQKKTYRNTDYSNYRPVCNLPLCLKLIERVASEQINKDTTVELMDEPMQSAYKTFHCTDNCTALSTK